MRALIFVGWLGLSACSSTPAAIEPMECPSEETPPDAAPLIPPEDEALVRWKAIVANQGALPPGTTAASLLPELYAYLGSPDPVRRDEVAFSIFTFWLRGNVLTSADSKAVAAELVANLSGALDEVNGSFRRSFSVLVLSEVMRREARTPFLSADERASILDAIVDYAGYETDLRGHTGETGWVHAAAHTGDVLWRFAQVPTYSDADRARMLAAAAAFVVRPHGTILAYGEDARLGTGVAAIVRAGVALDAIDAWIATLRAPLITPPTAQFDAAQFAAQRNVRNLVYTLIVQLSLVPTRTAAEQHTLDGLRALVAG